MSTSKVDRFISEASKNLKHEVYAETTANILEALKDPTLRSFIDQDEYSPLLDKALSVQIKFVKDGTLYTRTEITNALVRQCRVDSRDIIALGPERFNHHWNVTLSEVSVVDAIVKHPPKLHGGVAEVVAAGATLKQLRVHWLPAFIPNSTVLVFLSQYGVVKSLDWERPTTSGGRISNIRKAVLAPKPEVVLPHEESIWFERSSYRCLVTVQGRGAQCYQCKAEGHMKNKCRAPFCRTCKRYTNHTTENCTSQTSYASKARGPSHAPTDNGDGDADSEPEVEHTRIPPNRPATSQPDRGRDGASTSAPVHVPEPELEDTTPVNSDGEGGGEPGGSAATPLSIPPVALVTTPGQYKIGEVPLHVQIGDTHGLAPWVTHDLDASSDTGQSDMDTAPTPAQRNQGKRKNSTSEDEDSDPGGGQKTEKRGKSD